MQTVIIGKSHVTKNDGCRRMQMKKKTKDSVHCFIFGRNYQTMSLPPGTSIPRGHTTQTPPPLSLQCLPPLTSTQIPATSSLFKCCIAPTPVIDGCPKII